MVNELWLEVLMMYVDLITVLQMDSIKSISMETNSN